MVQDHYITDDEARVTAQDFANAVAKTLAVKLEVGVHYKSFLRLVQDALALARELQLTPAKYEFYAAIEVAEFDEHFMESANLHGAELESKIAFVVLPGVVRTTDCNERLLDQPAILNKPQVFLEPASDVLAIDAEQPEIESSLEHETSYYADKEMEETDLGAGFCSVTGALKDRCIDFSALQTRSPDSDFKPPWPKVYTCSSIQELTEALGCCLLVSEVTAQSGYLQHKRQFLHKLSFLPNVCHIVQFICANDKDLQVYRNTLHEVCQKRIHRQRRIQ